MCQICPVSGVPYLCIEVHVQTTFIYAFCLPGFLLEESSHLRLESKPLQERRRQRANPSPHRLLALTNLLSEACGGSSFPAEITL